MRSTHFKEAVTKFLFALALFNSGEINENEYKKLVRESAQMIGADMLDEAQAEDEQVEEERKLPRAEPDIINL